MNRFKKIPRKADGTIDCPPERFEQWIMLEFVQYAMRNGMILQGPARDSLDPMLYNVAKRANFLRESWLDLGLAVAQGDFEKATKLAARQIKAAKTMLFAED